MIFPAIFFSNGKNPSFLVVHSYPLVGDFTGLWTPTLADGFRPHSPMYIFGGSGVPSRCMDWGISLSLKAYSFEILDGVLHFNMKPTENDCVYVYV